MELWLQILLGAAGFLLISVLLAIFWKKLRWVWITAAILMVLSAAASWYISDRVLQTEPPQKTDAVTALGRTDAMSYIQLASALLDQSQVQGAVRLLDDYVQDCVVSDDYLLARARTEAVRGSYQQSAGIYRQLIAERSPAAKEDILTRELNAVREVQAGQMDASRLLEVIRSGIAEMKIPEQMFKAAKDYLLISSMDRSNFDPKIAAYVAAHLERLNNEESTVLGSRTMRMAMMKSLVLSGQYGRIVEMSDLFTDTDSQLVMAELCRQGLITGRMIRSSEHLAASAEENDRILSWIGMAKSGYKYSEAELKLLENAETLLESTRRDSAKSFSLWLENTLRAKAENGDSEASKIYLELARIFFDRKMSDEASNCLRLCLLYGSDSRDPDYAGAVNAINEILRNKDDTEQLKHLDEYVDYMVYHMEPEDMKPGSDEEIDWDYQDFTDLIEQELLDEDWETQAEDAMQEHAGEDAEEPDDPENEPGENPGEDPYHEPGEEPYHEPGEDPYHEPGEEPYTEPGEGGKEEPGEEQPGNDGPNAQEPGGEDEPANPSTDEEFSQFVNEEVNQITASISIASVDASGFETVRAVVAIDESMARTADEFRRYIQVFDCGIEITDCQVEKIEDVGVNIILVCDNSGSMSGDKINNLRDALRIFAAGLADDVDVGIVSFDSGILSSASCPLGASSAQISEAIDHMGAYGGTRINTGVRAALDQMSAGDELNVIIVMSDGQDNALSTSEMDELRRECGERDVAIYTMGLGSDVDSAVLSGYSTAGGGQYTFVSNSDSLLSFYQYLYQISRNRFRITFTAKDTIQVNRNLQVIYTEDRKVNDRRTYSLYTSELGGEDLGEDYLVTLEGLTIGGLDTRLLYKSVSDQTVRLLGENLTADKTITVSIQSGLSYDLACAYESDTAWTVTVPGAVACGEYDVIVTVDGRRTVFTSGLVVTDGRMNLVRFGDYVFRASSLTQMDNAVRLSGYVVMNDWLSFTGDVILTGDRERDSQITMEAQRCCVQYHRGDTALNGIAALMAENGILINIPIYEDFTLYRNEGISPSDESFQVDTAVMYSGISLKDVFTLETPGMSIYPDRLSVDFNKFTTAFPFQNKLLEAGKLDKLFDFSLDHKEELTISDRAVDCSLEFSLSRNDTDNFREARFCNLRLLLNLDELTLKLDTSTGSFSFKTMVNLMTMSSKLGNKAGFGLELGWTGGKFDTARIFADFDVDTNISGVPVTFSDFSLGVSGVGADGFNTMMLEGGCKISAVKISKVLPGIEDYIGDVAVFSLDDVKMELRIHDPYISLGAKAKFLEAIELGSAKIELGRGISYTNNLISYSGESVNGFVGQAAAGIKFETDNCDIDGGVDARLALTDRVCGLNAGGHVKATWKWWIFQDEVNLDGKLFIGLYTAHNNSRVFSVVVQGNNGKRYHIDWNERGRIA